MKYVRRATVASGAAAFGFFVVAIVGSAAAAPARVAQPERVAKPLTTDRIMTYTTPGPPLLNAVTQTMQGTKAADGSCIWHPPPLTLQPGQTSVESEQVSADLTNCTTVVETGTPAQTTLTQPSGEQIASSQPQSTVQGTGRVRRLSRASGYTASEATFRVTYYDPFNVDVNHVDSIIAWTWGNGSCIVGYTPTSGTYAEGYTGWSRSDWNYYGLTSCESDYSYSSADFANYIFCVPPTYTHYYNVWVRGGYLGGYGGNVDSVSATGGCTYLLHWSQQLTKNF